MIMEVRLKRYFEEVARIDRDNEEKLDQLEKEHNKQLEILLARYAEAKRREAGLSNPPDKGAGEVIRKGKRKAADKCLEKIKLSSIPEEGAANNKKPRKEQSSTVSVGKSKRGRKKKSNHTASERSISTRSTSRARDNTVGREDRAGADGSPVQGRGGTSLAPPPTAPPGPSHSPLSSTLVGDKDPTQIDDLLSLRVSSIDIFTSSGIKGIERESVKNHSQSKGTLKKPIHESSSGESLKAPTEENDVPPAKGKSIKPIPNSSSGESSKVSHEVSNIPPPKDESLNPITISSGVESLKVSPDIDCHSKSTSNSKKPDTISRQDRSESPSPDRKEEVEAASEPASKEASPNLSPEDIVEASPKIRRTRSKALKKKPQLSPIEDDEVAPKVSPVKRVTRSKAPPVKEPKPESRTPPDGSSDGTKTKSGSDLSKDSQLSSNSGSQGSRLISSKIPMMNPVVVINKGGPQSIQSIFSPQSAPAPEKENEGSRPWTGEKKLPTLVTPLQIRNAIFTPPPNSAKAAFQTAKLHINSAIKMKVMAEEEQRKKEEEATRKRTEMMKAKQEEIRRKNEEKKVKVDAIREAKEKVKAERFLKLQKEKEERERLAKEMERKRELEVAKRRQLNEQKVQCAETRRLKEEEARQAKIKEMEDEKKKEEEMKIKHQEDMERIKKQRLEEARMKEAAMKAAAEAQKKKAAAALAQQNEKCKDNYDIRNEPDSDTEEDYQKSKKDYPLWARNTEEIVRLSKIHFYVSNDIVHKYFDLPSTTPDLTVMFGKMTMKRMRTSSAVWSDPPHIFATFR